MEKDILIIDQSLVVRKILRRYLQETNLKTSAVHEAKDSTTAKEVIGEKSIGLLFLNLDMPEMNSLEFLKGLRKDGKNGNVKIVIVSSNESDTEDDELVELGVNAKLSKPLRPDDFFKTVKTVVEKSES